VTHRGRVVARPDAGHGDSSEPGHESGAGELQGTGAMSCFANAGPSHGRLRYGEAPSAGGVLEALDYPMPGGWARGVGWDPDGLGRAGRRTAANRPPMALRGQRWRPMGRSVQYWCAMGAHRGSGVVEAIANSSIMWI
jgi:hypothetical protein